ncbi:hypothetical protein ABIB40_002477 [Pedobacter sp. UYP30]|uniref:7TM diverse intracellular signaling domain-containing protein n=1 Tax=Pedobacter sp. UYP30 TaxID=1756400 RepID=UPI003396C52E
MKTFFKTLGLFIFFPVFVLAQKQVKINDAVSQHIFTFDEVCVLEDSSNALMLKDILKPEYNNAFKPNLTSTPQNLHLQSTYWYRINIAGEKDSKKNWILEFFDQTIDDLVVYLPDSNNHYVAHAAGDEKVFSSRSLAHKNFEFRLQKESKSQLIYVKVKSRQIADVIVVLRSVDWFIHYALNEYLLFGLFYGMILIFSFYNLVMYFAVRQIQYLYYVLYNLSVGIFELSSDGLAYQYLWPNSPHWNQYAFGVALYSVSIFALLFAKKLLHLKTKSPFLNKLINGFLALRTLFFFACVFINPVWFNYKFLELIPLLLSYVAGIMVYKKGYKPARFFVLGYTFLFVGFVIKFLITLGVTWLNIDAIAYYSLSICFILEMFFLSFSIGDNFRILKLKKEKAQRRIIDQFKVNEKLKDNLNKQLEDKVALRTKEVYEKSALIIEKNKELVGVNRLLKEQSEEITRMNSLLSIDNVALKTNVAQATRARIMDDEVNFEEFSNIYPDKETCCKLLGELKWSDGFKCKRCGGDQYFQGHQLYSRRCSKCSYEESVTNGTLFQNSRIAINKGFYLLFLNYQTKGKISSHKLSEILQIRQSTCWTYSTKIKKLITAKIKNGTFDKTTWSTFLLTED